jgi:hypothetical protein
VILFLPPPFLLHDTPRQLLFSLLFSFWIITHIFSFVHLSFLCFSAFCLVFNFLCSSLQQRTIDIIREVTDTVAVVVVVVEADRVVVEAVTGAAAAPAAEEAAAPL